MTSVAVRPQLCLILETTPEACARLEAALANASPTALIVAPASGALIDKTIAAELVGAAHNKNLTALIENDTGLAKALGADGVHLSWRPDIEETYAAARRELGPGAVVGVESGRSRHDAMSLGERGADYIAFAVADEGPGRAEATADRLDLVQWWAEIFEVPAVALHVETADDAARLAVAGADFVAARVPPGLAPHEIGAWASDIMDALGASHKAK